MLVIAWQLFREKVLDWMMLTRLFHIGPVQSLWRIHSFFPLFNYLFYLLEEFFSFFWCYAYDVCSFHVCQFKPFLFFCHFSLPIASFFYFFKKSFLFFTRSFFLHENIIRCTYLYFLRRKIRKLYGLFRNLCGKLEFFRKKWIKRRRVLMISDWMI